MKKIWILCFTLLFFSSPSFAWERAGGISLQYAGIDTKVTDDIDNNGSVDTTKDITNDVGIPSLFIEGTNTFGTRGSLTVGLDIIPFEAEFDSRSTTQSSVKGKDDGAATSGTNRGTVTISNHLTIYVQPGVQVNDDVTLFATAAYVTSDAEAEVTSVSSTNKTVDLTLDGTKLGVGLKKNTNFGFMKLEYAKTDYDPISVTTSNSTKVTGDMDNTGLTLSFGKSF